jgi:hypothetical protein
MYEDLMGAYGGRFLLAAGGVGIGLLLLIGVLLIVRNRAPSPFIRGGRNRQPRLQVLDAAAVDTRRRLVLVRRDDVEHLIMIGGPTDIVIESRILPDTDDVPASAAAPVFAEPAAIAARGETPVAQPARLAAPVARDLNLEEAYPPTPAPLVEPRARPEQPVAATPAPIAVERETPLRTPPTPPVITPRPQERPAAAALETEEAADILDAARQRVLTQPQRIEPQVFTSPAQSLPTVAEGRPVVTEDGSTHQPAAPDGPRGDFQRILDEEMAGNLTAERLVPAGNAPLRPVPQPGNLPRRDPELAPITGADVALQNEVARIFGEMSVNRDK